jgi:alkylation response protein AidB-like acyl-CoA dehydrogenase
VTLNYGLSAEQRIIADSAAALFRDCFSSDTLRHFVRDRRLAVPVKQALGQSGLLGVCASEMVGGAGLGATDALALGMEAGRRCSPWPVSESVVGAALLARSYPALAKGIIAATSSACFVTGLARTALVGGVLVVSGTFRAVAWASQSRWLIVPAQEGDGDRLFLVDLEQPAVRRSERKSIDPSCPTSDVYLEQATGEVIPNPAGVRWKELLTLLATAEMIGAAQTCLDMAVDYMKVRKQFGQEIGRFQALKHIAANDALYVENMRLAVEYAVWAHDAAAADADESLDVAKEYCSEQARTIAEDAIQCHGGIGFTWDYDLHFYLRRILRLAASLGTAVDHRERIAERLIERFSPEASR